jgi:hypothetical protein
MTLYALCCSRRQRFAILARTRSSTLMAARLRISLANWPLP